MFSSGDDQAAYERNSLTMSSALPAAAAAGNRQRLGLNIVVSESRVASPDESLPLPLLPNIDEAST